MKTIVIGGGLAGMAAAVALESAGVDVTLLEARKTLGGRAGSFEDPQTGEELDNCQHVLLGCCTNLIDFYRRIGADHLIRFERTIHFRDSTGRLHDLFGVQGLPAPLHLGPAMLRFSALTWQERVELSRAMIEMIALGKSGREKLDHLSFGQWLDDHGQSPSLVRKLYDAILIGALNEETRRASAKYAIKVFQDSLLAHADGYLIGLPTSTLAELYRRIPCRDVRLSTRVASIESNRVTLQSGETLAADNIVLATNHHSVSRWIPTLRFDLQDVPILGVHLWFDLPVMSESHAALFDGPLQWIFRKDSTGTSLHGVISAAREWVDQPKERMLQQFEQQVRMVLPEARDAKLLRGVIVIEKRATFAPLPGVDRIRPSQKPLSQMPNLYLAGDYTQTGWPATMEGAVRSGYRAAELILPNARFVVDDLPVQWPARLLGLHR